MKINPELSIADLCNGMVGIPPGDTEAWDSLLDTIEQEHPAIAAFAVHRLIIDLERLDLANMLVNLLIERRKQAVDTGN